MKFSPKKVGDYTTPDGAKIYYEVYGHSGPVVIATYGIACLINHWHYQFENLSQDFQIVVYDLRGHHKSTRGTEPITMDLLAQDLLGLFSHIFPEENFVHLWGHSFGVPIAYRAAAMKPDTVKSLALINGFYKNPFEKDLTKSQALNILECFEAFYSSAPSFTKWIWSLGVDNPAFSYLAGVLGGFNLERISHKDIQNYAQGLSILNLKYFLEHFKVLIEFDGTEYFKEIKAKTLVLHGGRDKIVPYNQNKQLADSLKYCRFFELHEGSHCSQLDLPYQVNLELKKHTLEAVS